MVDLKFGNGLVWTCLVALPVLLALWVVAVAREVPEPYLDEVFHVGQAQTYCAGRFSEWDPKITTPPGVYLLSYVVFEVTGYCDETALRALNAVLLFALFLALLFMVSPATSRVVRGPRALSSLSPQHVHTALNICLFPPIVFFSALYYTDVASTLFVVLFFKDFLEIHSRGTPTMFQSLRSILYAVASLFFRQTNIFWVSIFPIGLVAVRCLAEEHVQSKDSVKRTADVPRAIRSVVDRSWNGGMLYDPQVRGAWSEDYLYSIMSMAVRAVRVVLDPPKLLRLLTLVLPYMIVLALFGSFVLWNGGVVLGDKSNHVATIHLPQMLYLWAYMTFFSLPLSYPFLLQALFALLALVPALAILEPLLIFQRQKILPRPLTILFFLTLGVLTVHYNTLIHPFTLADNRHYTFYIFRILLRRPWLKHLAVPIYLAASWSILQTLGAAPPEARLSSPTAPDAARHVSSPAHRAAEHEHSSPAPTPTPTPTPTVFLNAAAEAEGASASLVLVWLVTTALQLVTAPLVEPRYFIVPWLMWRLRVPLAREGGAGTCAYASASCGLSAGSGTYWSCSSEEDKEEEEEEEEEERERKAEPEKQRGKEKQKQKQKQNGKGKREERKRGEKHITTRWHPQAGHQHDHRLWLETLWFLAIDIVTGYVFLTWRFEWAQEPGKVQRFMW